MKLEQYEEIVSVIDSYKCIDIHCIEVLEEKFSSIRRGTLSSIFANEIQNWTKSKFAKAQDSAVEIYSRYKAALENNEPAGILVKLSDEYEIPYSLTAKIVLSKHYTEINDNTNDVVTMNAVKKQLRDTALIEDKKLAYEVFMCTILDDQYSPTSEIIRMNLGQQYEIKLYKQMEKFGIAFRSEEYMRSYGFDKTPDVKLEIPIAVDGFIINWIESKARFGTFEVHNDYLKNQYISYWNRFGPGLIIYWFGFLDDLDEPSEKRFLIRDHLPANIFKLNK